MATPVYLLVIGRHATEAWHQLSKEEQDRLWAQAQEVDRSVGAKWIIQCDARWADEEVSGWGVLEYPSMEAYLQKVEGLEKLNWWRYIRVKSILGVKSTWG